MGTEPGQNAKSKAQRTKRTLKKSAARTSERASKSTLALCSSPSYSPLPSRCSLSHALRLSPAAAFVDFRIIVRYA